MADYETVGTQFITYYYTTFDADRRQLQGLYRDDSMLTFESASVLGVANIMQKLTNLPFQRITHDIPGSTKDYQPTKDGILVLVTGLLQIDDEERPMKFSQTFHLVKDPAGTYYVYNDIFKLIFG